jgi:hypothetical protein
MQTAIVIQAFIPEAITRTTRFAGRAEVLQAGSNASSLGIMDPDPSLAGDFYYRQSAGEARFPFLCCQLTWKAIGKFELDMCFHLTPSAKASSRLILLCYKNGASGFAGER